ncbi:MAG: hypothetical protein C4531_00265 [Desulfurivibrio sp.]|nr:MAG: hypothetical protein C4531_00265 [Desulfurivibrio sp.]
MKSIKKLTAILCILGMAMIGTQAFAADGTKTQIKKRTQTHTMSGTQSGTISRVQTRSSY